MLENHQQFYHTFFELCIYQGSIQKSLEKQLCLTFPEFYISQVYNQIQKNICALSHIS